MRKEKQFKIIISANASECFGRLLRFTTPSSKKSPLITSLKNLLLSSSSAIIITSRAPLLLFFLPPSAPVIGTSPRVNSEHRGQTVRSHSPIKRKVSAGYWSGSLHRLQFMYEVLSLLRFLKQLITGEQKELWKWKTINHCLNFLGIQLLFSQLYCICVNILR